MSVVKGQRRLHETGPDSPWGEGGQLRLPGWIEQAGPMPPSWPVFWFWAMIGKDALDRAGHE